MISKAIMFATTNDVLDIEGFFRTASFMIDKTIFGLIPKVFNLIMQIASETIFNTTDLNNFANNIYAIIGVFMLFRLAFVLLNAIIDPDKLTDSKQGAGKMLMKLIISLVLIVAIPWGFDQAFALQNIILDKGILSKVILGSSGTSTNSDGTTSTSTILSCPYIYQSDSATGTTSTLVLSVDSNLTINYTFSLDGGGAGNVTGANLDQSVSLQELKDGAYYFCPTIIYEYSRNADGSLQTSYTKKLLEPKLGYTNPKQYAIDTNSPQYFNKSFGTTGAAVSNGVKEGKTISKTVMQSFLYCNPAVDTETSEVNCSSSDLMGYFDEAFNLSNNDEPTFDTLSSVLNNEVYTGTVVNYVYKYNIILSTIAGGFVLFMLVMFAFDVGLRVVKLGFLQLMAPVAVIGYLDPKGEIFNKWLKMTISTYVSLFIRMVAIYFVTYLITILATKTGLPNLTRVFIIFGALMFAKEAPKLLANLFGLDEGSMGSFGNPFKKMLGGGALMGAAGLGMSLAGKGASALGGAGLGTAKAALNNNHGRSMKDILNPKNIGSNAKALGRGAAVGAKSGFNSMKLNPKATLGSTLKGVGGGVAAGYKGAGKDERLKAIADNNFNDYAYAENKKVYDKYKENENDTPEQKEYKRSMIAQKIIKNRLLPDKAVIEANKNKNIAKENVKIAQAAQKRAEFGYQKEQTDENQAKYEKATKALKEAETIKETLDANYEELGKDPKHAKAVANLKSYEATTKNEKAQLLVNESTKALHKDPKVEAQRTEYSSQMNEDDNGKIYGFDTPLPKESLSQTSSVGKNSGLTTTNGGANTTVNNTPIPNDGANVRGDSFTPYNAQYGNANANNSTNGGTNTTVSSSIPNGNANTNNTTNGGANVASNTSIPSGNANINSAINGGANTLGGSSIPNGNATTNKATNGGANVVGDTSMPYNVQYGNANTNNTTNGVSTKASQPETRDDRKDSTAWNPPVTEIKSDSTTQPRMMGTMPTNTSSTNGNGSTTSSTSGLSEKEFFSQPDLTKASVDQFFKENPSDEPTIIKNIREKISTAKDNIKDLFTDLKRPSGVNVENLSRAEEESAIRSAETTRRIRNTSTDPKIINEDVEYLRQQGVSDEVLTEYAEKRRSTTQNIPGNNINDSSKDIKDNSVLNTLDNDNDYMNDDDSFGE